MTEKKKRRSYLDRHEICENYLLKSSEFYGQGRLSELKESIEKLIEREGPETYLYSQIDHDGYGEHYYINYFLMRNRMENDEEYEKRITQERERRKQQKEMRTLIKQKEYQTYLKLKEKYEQG